MIENCKKRWLSIDSCVMSKKVWGDINAKASKSLLSLRRNSHRKIIFDVTGHWPIGIQGKRMKIPVSEFCESCGQAAECITPENFWFACPGLSDKIDAKASKSLLSLSRNSLRKMIFAI
uniref:Reverse transcriptase zinc-binding domain-containing protein n=1 Tax=Megaselia scalaris TaxID=36166 RepID=T1GXI4_MEGSC